MYVLSMCLHIFFCQVITLDMGLLVAGTKYRGEFEERLKKLMEEIRQNDDIILFIDEVHTLIGAGAAEGAIDAANILKPALARGELQVIFLILSIGLMMSKRQLIEPETQVFMKCYFFCFYGCSVLVQQRWMSTGSTLRKILRWRDGSSL